MNTNYKHSKSALIELNSDDCFKIFGGDGFSGIGPTMTFDSFIDQLMFKKLQSRSYVDNSAPSTEFG